MFGYKHADLDYSYSDGAATIKTPDFDVNTWIEQDSEDAGSYRFVTEVGTFRKPTVVSEEKFLQLFTGYCDAMIVKFAVTFPVQETIDKIEKIPQWAECLDYDADATWLTLELENPKVRIRVTEDTMEFSLIGHGNLKQLFTDSNSAISALGRSGLTLLLPEKT